MYNTTIFLVMFWADARNPRAVPSTGHQWPSGVQPRRMVLVVVGKVVVQTLPFYYYFRIVLLSFGKMQPLLRIPDLKYLYL